MTESFRIHSIEVENFKSWKGKHIIGPFKKFTSVIGPNGSGKSNLMDAISFVLGVDASHLRGSKLKDLIFTPTTSSQSSQSSNKGKNSSPSNASVTICIEKVLYTDSGTGTEESILADERILECMAFRRSVNKSSKSTYSRANISTHDRPNLENHGFNELNSSELNKEFKISSWADFDQALARIGILTKAKNFLVFQGDVADIATTTGQQITDLLELMSGSGHLKSDYEKLLKVRDEATENAIFTYQKVRGVTQERKQVKEQKEEAEKYYALKDKRSTLARESALWKFYHYQDRKTIVDTELVDFERQSAELEKERIAAEKQVQLNRKAQGATGRKKLTLEKKLKGEEARRAETSKEHITAKEKVSFYSKRVQELKKKSVDIGKARDTDKTTQEEMAKQLKKAEAELQELETAYAEQESQSDSQLLEQQLQELQACKDTLAKETVDLQEELKPLERSAQLEQSALDRHASNLKAFQERYDTHDNARKSLEQRIADLTEVNTKTKASQKRAEQELTRLKESSVTDSKRKEELSRLIKELGSREQFAQAQKGESEREARFSKTLDQLKTHFPGRVHDRLFSLVSLSNKKYSVAATVALGQNMDAIVVEDEATAHECIDYMKQQRLSTATFLPLSTIRPSKIREGLRSLPGATLLVDCLKYSREKFERAVSYACGNVIIADDLSTARKLAWDHANGERLKVVTLDGTLLRRSSLMTGGIAGVRDKARRWDQREIREMKTQRDRYLKEYSALSNSHKTKTQVESVNAELKAYSERLRVSDWAIKEAQKNLDKTKAQVAEAKEAIDKESKSIEALQVSLGKTRKAMDAIQAKIDVQKKNIFASLPENVQEINKYQEEKQKREHDFNKKKLGKTNVINRLKQAMEYHASRRTSNNAGKIEADLKEESAELESWSKKRDAFAKELAKRDAQVAATRKQWDELEVQQQDKEASIAEFKKAQSEAIKTLDSLQKKMSTARAKLAEIQQVRYDLLKACTVDEITLPFIGTPPQMFRSNSSSSSSSSSSSDTPMTDASEEGSAAQSSSSPSIGGIGMPDNFALDFSELEKGTRKASFPSNPLEEGKRLDERIAEIDRQIESMAPNMRALEKYADVNKRKDDTQNENTAAKEAVRKAEAEFEDIRERRIDLFNHCFSHVSAVINPIYKELTKSNMYPMGGTAYLTIENPEEPYNGGVKFSCMPPSKRIRNMGSLSGGEKTVAALALLFALHSYKPSPFFVLDEVDAALDADNVAKVARYISSRAAASWTDISKANPITSTDDNVPSSPSASPEKLLVEQDRLGEDGKNREQAIANSIKQPVQFLVISLKDNFYDKAESLVGVCKAPATDSSTSLTLDLTQWAGQ